MVNQMLIIKYIYRQIIYKNCKNKRKQFTTNTIWSILILKYIRWVISMIIYLFILFKNFKKIEFLMIIINIIYKQLINLID